MKYEKKINTCKKQYKCLKCPIKTKDNIEIKRGCFQSSTASFITCAAYKNQPQSQKHSSRKQCTAVRLKEAAIKRQRYPFGLLKQSYKVRLTLTAADMCYIISCCRFMKS